MTISKRDAEIIIEGAKQYMKGIENKDEMQELMYEDYEPGTIKDPEMRQEALRYNTDKPELSYIFTFPHALKGFAEVCTYGGKKYNKGNYLIGAPLSQYMDCLMRHLVAWNNGEDQDTESHCDHLAHVVWNALCLYEMAVSQPERDDRINQDIINNRKVPCDS